VTTWVTTGSRLARPSSTEPLEHHQCDNAAKALRAGGVVVVFPGGDCDVYRPTVLQNVIDFNGRTGYVRTAIEAGVPIVPAVSIGGQESQLYLSRGTWLAERLRLKRLLRSEILPISVGSRSGSARY
jgi:1-acyl-sn-glycerol-3-phosphate acyltransferase